ncbi:MAG: hypothetical protein BGO10_10710 [Chlamydia sp. 32-24]|nr:MAG: hypothetical protein BGO10_10710 [Chlamydia sp. 32-24]
MKMKTVFFLITLLSFCLNPKSMHAKSFDFREIIQDPYESHDPSCKEDCQDPPLTFVNLEDKAQDFVLESKQISIPGYLTAFNPTIIRWKNSLLLAFRIRHPVTAITNYVGLVWLDDDFNIKSQVYILDIPHQNKPLPSKLQDPRLITINDQLYMVFSDIIPGTIIPEVRRVFISQIHFDGVSFIADNPECLSKFKNEREQRWEKNWTPFVYNNELFLSYSLSPHRILKPLPGTGSCDEFASTTNSIQWKWGVLRGGTQAFLIDNDHYLSFFHTSISMATTHSNGKLMPHYFMGAYLFSSQPPFEIKQVSPRPIIGKGFYSGPAYKTWKPLRVVFPCGFVFDNDYIWVTYGKQDHEIWVAKIHKKKLLKSLVPVNSLQTN